MYKVFCNGTEIIFTDLVGDLKEVSGGKNVKVYRTSGPSEEQVEKWLEKPAEVRRIFLSNNPSKSWKSFKKRYEKIVAGGGIVLNENDHFLTIFRRGFWDLPKGKIEKDETVFEGAVREIEEETGIRADQLLFPKPDKTWHLYRIKKGVVIKKSVWYWLRAEPGQQPVPQFAEDITQATWMSGDQMDEVFDKGAYPALKGIWRRKIDLL
ncbi:NUDIX domain-containing protein [bacterium SCSIO 12741]|nr:NUDIX domain-containing protein [bacterium SCSIO 12741]